MGIQSDNSEGKARTMKVLLLTLAVIASAYAEDLHPIFFGSAEYVPYIIGGRPVRIQDHPHQISLQNSWAATPVEVPSLETTKWPVLPTAHRAHPEEREFWLVLLIVLEVARFTKFPMFAIIHNSADLVQDFPMISQ